MTKRTLDLDAAAQALGISKEALRKRIKRGSIEAIKNQAGRWQVEVEEPGPDARADFIPDAGGDVVQALQKHIDFLEKELERKDHLLMAYIQKMPQLEAPKEHDRRPWYKKLFGGA